MFIRSTIVVALVIVTGGSSRPCPTLCSCNWERSPLRALERADVVIEGVALDSMIPVASGWAAVHVLDTISQPTDSLFQQAFELFRIRILVDRVWKGQVSDTLAVFTDEPKGGCGFTFAHSERYVLFLYRSPTGHLNASYCSLSQPRENADTVVSKLGQPIRTRAA